MRLTPLDIYQQEFRRVLRGLDPDEVEDFLEKIADDYEQLIKENADLKDRLEALEVQLAAGGKTGQPETLSMGKIPHTPEDSAREETSNIVTQEATKEAESLIREARKEADNIIREAGVEADRIRAEAEMIAKATRSEAQTRPNEFMEKARTEELELRREISKLRAHKERFLIEYRDLLEKHLKILTSGFEE